MIDHKQLNELGQQIDSASDNADSQRLQELEEQFAKLCGPLSPGDDLGAYIWYFRSNIHAALQDIAGRHAWEWRLPHRERQILYLRRAAAHPAFIRLATVSKASILTNIGNALSLIGRGLEAISLYDAALQNVPNFAMALGNRGEAMYALLPNIPDPGHAILIAASAVTWHRRALAEDATWEGGSSEYGQYFAATQTLIASRMDVDATIAAVRLDEHSLGKSKAEKAYRRWALHHELFLNPLSVIGPHAIGATDRLNLPSHVAPIGDPPTFIAWFNQMKQEFVSARWFLYEGVQQERHHFVDREVFLVNTLDYPQFGIQTEKLRTAFRIAYGLLDKIAGFVNAYFKLGLDTTQVDLRRIWHPKKGAALRPEFTAKANLHLRGLYWLSQDIIGDDPQDQDSIAPEAPELKRLRNLLEHRCLVLRLMDLKDPMGSVETARIEDFRESTMHIVRLARFALMYLAMSLRKEEADRMAEKEQGPIMPGIPLPIL